MSVFVCLLFIAVMAFGLSTNLDLMSPAKFFLISFLMFYVGGLFDNLPTEVWMLVMQVLLVGAVAVLFEALQPRRRNLTRIHSPAPAIDRRGLAHERRLFVWLWIFSTPAILSQLYMVQAFGGIEGYINSLAMRVIEWQGMGWAKTVIATLMPANLVYFAVGLIRPRTKRWWALYGVHFLLLLLLGLMSGSRSSILNVFALQLFCYHYVKRPVGLRHLGIIGAVLVVSALVLGVVREGVKVDGGELVTGLEGADSKLKIATFRYGVEPLDLLVKADSLSLAYGGTFISLFTNAIPRVWWPDKPDTGGVFFTKVYTGDEWDGASNLTPTFLGEWIINFGWAIGSLLFLIAYPALMYLVIKRYRRVVHRLRSAKSSLAAVEFVSYLLMMWTIVALMTGEVTNILLSFFLTQFIPLAIVTWKVRRDAPRRLSVLRRLPASPLLLPPPAAH